MGDVCHDHGPACGAFYDNKDNTIIHSDTRHMGTAGAHPLPVNECLDLSVFSIRLKLTSFLKSYMWRVSTERRCFTQFEKPSTAIVFHVPESRDTKRIWP
jgi:hypothetical protein